MSAKRVTREEANEAATKAMEALDEARAAEALPPDVIDSLEEAAAALIADLTLSRTSRGEPT